MIVSQNFFPRLSVDCEIFMNSQEATTELVIGEKVSRSFEIEAVIVKLSSSIKLYFTPFQKYKQQFFIRREKRPSKVLGFDPLTALRVVILLLIYEIRFRLAYFKFLGWLLWCQYKLNLRETQPVRKKNFLNHRFTKNFDSFLKVCPPMEKILDPP